eukprot:2409113-Pyramimonas_sp.AAC.1
MGWLFLTPLTRIVASSGGGEGGGAVDAAASHIRSPPRLPQGAQLAIQDAPRHPPPKSFAQAFRRRLRGALGRRLGAGRQREGARMGETTHARNTIGT